MINKIKNLFSLIKNPRDPFYYFQGYIRMFLYNKAPYLLRSHILDQYHIRYNSSFECVKKGQCYCGCKTPELFFANKPCYLTELTVKNRLIVAGKKEPCYGPMLNKKEFNKLLNTK